MLENTQSEINPGISPHTDPEIKPQVEIDPEVKIDYRRQDLSWADHLSKTFHSNSFHRGPVRRSARVTSMWSMAAACIDGLILFAGACFLLMTFGIAFHLHTQQIISDFKQLAHFAQQVFHFSVSHQTWFDLQQNTLTGFLMLLPMMIFFYLTWTRIYLGFSLGEWACYLRMGRIEQRLSPQYSWWVVQRTFLIFITGFVFLPILSALLGTDVAGLITGLCITNKPPKKPF